MRPPHKLFARPWRLEEHEESFELAEHGSHPLAYVYCENEPTRRSSTRRTSKDDARRMAAQIVRLLELLEGHCHIKQIEAGPAARRNGLIAVGTLLGTQTLAFPAADFQPAAGGGFSKCVRSCLKP
ncbi:hypothetical protein SAMN05444161_7488 [Rhizobiales bacterium GAS191]|nr:hypothetical protein SAMN05444161_7488 [Rhizobiales bacterium GAS191]